MMLSRRFVLGRSKMLGFLNELETVSGKAVSLYVPSSLPLSEAESLIEKVLESRKHPEQAYKVCMGILSLAKKHSDERLNKICGRANRFGTSSYKRIESMIKLDVEQQNQPQLIDCIPEHENIRGAEYYH